MNTPQKPPLRFERATGLIVTDDEKATPVLIVASSQMNSVGYDAVKALNSHTNLLAAVECADAYELRDDWRDVLKLHGWDENEQVASVFIRQLRRAALAQVHS